MNNENKITYVIHKNKLSKTDLDFTYIQSKNTDKRKIQTLTQNKNKQKRTHNLRSETPEYRLIQGYLVIKNPNGQLIRARVALDTQSNASYSHPLISTPRLKHPYEVSNVIGVSGKPISLGDPLSFTIMKNGQSHHIDTTYLKTVL